MNEAGIGKLFSVMASFPFLTLRLPENLLAFGKFFTPGSQPKARPVSSNILLQGCGPPPDKLPLCGVRWDLEKKGAPSQSCTICQVWSWSEARGTGQREARATGRPVGACNLNLEKVLKKEILRQGKNRRDLETRKMRAWVKERSLWKFQPSQ